MENAFGYFAKDVAASLEITTSTLRRWCIELEKAGYSFERNEKDRRVFFERDFIALRELKKLTGNGVPFVDAINAVMATDFENKNAQKTPSVYGHEVRFSKREFGEIIDEVAKRTAEETAQAIQEKLSDEIEKRDRLLVEKMNQSIEQKQLAAASEKPEKKWWQFWK